MGSVTLRNAEKVDKIVCCNRCGFYFLQRLRKKQNKTKKVQDKFLSRYVTTWSLTQNVPVDCRSIMSINTSENLLRLVKKRWNFKAHGVCLLYFWSLPFN